MPILLHDAVLYSKYACPFAYLQSCMMDREHVTYCFLELDDMKFLRVAVLLGGLELRLKLYVPSRNRWHYYGNSAWQRWIVAPCLDLCCEGGEGDAPRILSTERLCRRVWFSFVIHRESRGTLTYLAGNVRTAFYLCVKGEEAHRTENAR